MTEHWEDRWDRWERVRASAGDAHARAHLARQTGHTAQGAGRRGRSTRRGPDHRGQAMQESTLHARAPPIAGAAEPLQAAQAEKHQHPGFAGFRRIRPGILILRPSARVLVSQRASVHHTAWTPVVLASDACQPAYTAMLPASGSGHDRAAHTTPSAQDMPVHCKSISSLAYLIVPGQQYQRVATTAAPPSACSQQHTPRQQQQQLCHPLRDKTIGKRRPNWSINNGVCLAISPVTFA